MAAAAAGAFLAPVADFMVPMTVLLAAAGALVFAAAAAGALEAAAAPPPPAAAAAPFFFTTVPVLVSLDSLTFRLPRVAVAVAGLLAAGLLPLGAGAGAGALLEDDGGAAPPVFLVRAVPVVVDPALELAEDVVVTFLARPAPAPAVPARAVPLVVVGAAALTGDAGRENVGAVDFVGEAGRSRSRSRSRAGMMRALDEVGDRICPCCACGGSTAGAPRIRFFGFSTAPWFSLSWAALPLPLVLVLISSLRRCYVS